MDDFIRQLPPGIIAYAVMIPVLIVLLLVYFAAIRPALENWKRRKAEESSLTPSTPSPIAPKPRPLPSLISDDMPDLDMLLASAVSPSAPAPRPAGPRQLGEAEVSLVTGKTVRAREELVLLRDPVDGRLIVQMPGATYKSFSSAPAAKESFSRLMNELAKSLAQPENTPAPTQPAPSESVAASPMPAVPEAPSPLPPIQTPAPQPPPIVIPPVRPVDKDVPMPGDLPRYSNMRGAELKGRGFLGGPKYKFEDIPDLNLGNSIEAYLQHRLQQTPGYEGRAWHVHPALDGGVRIEIDGLFFDSVSEIIDPTARTFIQTAIQEWQERQ